SWFSYGDQRLGQGKERAVEFIAAKPELISEIRGKVMDALSLGAKTKNLNDATEIDNGDAEVMEA
ncbi:MAG TPA: hypothetical protein VFN07_10115, partial [Trueperaceae bacterium]|nr:hypothetical protein [Trueperaceae bacterium]